MTTLLNIDKNAKTVKGQKRGYRTAVLYLAPARLSGYEVCPQRSLGCTAACLNTAGRGRMSPVQQARIARTKLYFEDRAAFREQLARELDKFIKACERDGFTPAVRLNGTSDLPWERYRFTRPGKSSGATSYASIFHAYPFVIFYDYTKVTKRMEAYCHKYDWPANYKLVFSRSEDNAKDCMEILRIGGNASFVFHPDIPETYTMPDGNTYEVLDGDEDDLRFLEYDLNNDVPNGRIVGLRAKGKGRADISGFVIPYCKEGAQ